MGVIFGTFLYSFGSAFIPVLNAEVGVVAAAKASSLPDFWVALVVALGQSLGKAVWFYAGMHSLKLKWMRKKLETEKWQASYAKWHGRIVGRPVAAGLIVFASAVTGFPPLAVISVLAGALRMSFTVFFVTVLAGRTIRFWLVLEGVGIAEWAFHH